MYSDTIRLHPNKCYHLPDDISFELGAAIFVNYLTAYFALFYTGNLKDNEVVFVKSCAGGVGCAVTQLAKTKKEVTVVGTASPSKHEFAKENGVDHIFTYDNLEEQIIKLYPRGFDVIIENESGYSFNSMSNHLRQLGRIVLLGANNLVTNDEKISLFAKLTAWWYTSDVSLLSLMMNNRTVGAVHLGVLVESEPEKVRSSLDEIFKLIRLGKICPKIDSVWNLEKIEAATKTLAERRNKGKVLLKIDALCT